MNRDRIKGLIVQLGKIPRSKFNMGSWLAGSWKHVVGGNQNPIGLEKHQCGTSACIAGWAMLMYSDRPEDGGSALRQGQDLLGLTSSQANSLFLAYLPNGGGQIAMGSITNQQAINTLERLLATGEVRWDLRNTPVS